MKYIDADLLQKDIDELEKETADCVGKYSDGFRFALEHFAFLIAHCIRQEQQEVDLEKELEQYARNHPADDAGSYRNLIGIARHFYELGKNSK